MAPAAERPTCCATWIGWCARVSADLERLVRELRNEDPLTPYQERLIDKIIARQREEAIKLAEALKAGQAPQSR